MFEKYGEFDSWEELNKAAEGFAEEGDVESLRGLAEENGIDPENADDMMEDGGPFCTRLEAAMGRLAVEEGEIKRRPPMEQATKGVILEIVKGMCADREEMPSLIMHKGKRVSDIYEAMKSEAGKNRSGNQPVCICGTDRDLQRLALVYYSGTEEAFKKAVEQQVRRGLV